MICMHSHETILIPCKPNQVRPSSIFIRHSRKNGAEHSYGTPSYEAIFISCESLQVSPGGILIRKKCKIISELLYCYFALLHIRAACHPVNLSLIYHY